MSTSCPTGDPLDLSFTRHVDLNCEKIWAAWTRPDLITQWFTPAPWKTAAAEIELRPGGRFYTLMRSPEGQEFPNTGCLLDVVPNRRLVWTNAMSPGFRPAILPPGGWHFTGIIALEPEAGGTRYTATVLHADAESCQKHAAMGFETGWGKALDQLVELMRRTPV